MAKKKPRRDWGPMGAWSIPKTLMLHPDFQQLSSSALKVLMVLGSQYNGRNNGNLAATYTMLAEWGGMAKGTLAAALRELQERRLIIKTRDHNRSRDGAAPALYALAWENVDDCPGKMLEVCPTIKPPRSLAA